MGVGKTYQFECPLCQYQAKISGGADGGVHCEIQTVICRDCRQLYDVYTKVQRRAGVAEKVKFPGFFRPEIPPVILRESTSRPGTSAPVKLVWQKFAPTCPVEAKHRVEVWKDPGRCPRCGCFMDKGGFPFRNWD
jgi:hypothetical protein